ncbi:hypothetical protein MD537_23420, partial [Flavihumibacter sediminis]|nr:hypothetical protein [Flavihumibacter sediminis]
PTTSELTELIRNVGFKCTDNETTITEFLYNTLSDKKKDVNFEMIISAIEELASFHAKSQNNSQPSIIGSLFESKYDSEILNFDLPKTKNNPNWRLNIPKGKL